MRLTTLDIKRIRRLRYRDGLTIPATAAIIGCNISTVWRYAPGVIGKVPNDKLRAAFEASPMTASDVARRMGWTCPPRRAGGRPRADSSRVKRSLGINPNVSPRGTRSYSRTIDAETAGLIAEALGLMAWEVMPDDDEQVAA